MATRQVDIAILGAGTAGLNAVSEARKSGRSWVVIDPGPHGTTCARVGCMPSKLLVYAAMAAHAARHCGEFGIRTGPVEVDGAAVMRRVRRERDRFVAGVIDGIRMLPEDNRLCGRARFVDATTLEVEGTAGPLRIATRATVIATGSEPRVPPVFDPVRDRILTSDSVFELTALPRTIAVVGTGIVGLELGQSLSRLGVSTTVFDRSQHIGPFTDPEVVRCVDQVVSDELALHMGADIVAAEPRGDGVALVWRQGGEEHSAVFDAVLVAAGRHADLAPLNMAATGLELDEHGQPPFDPGTTQCGDRPIFLAGDANGYRPLLHEGGDEGRIAGENAARWPDVQVHQRRTPLTVVFSDPQIALVGATYRELHAPGHSPVGIGAASFANQGRARVMARNQGIMRIYAGRADCRLLGAEMFGPHMEHMAHLLAWAVQQGTTVQQLLKMPVYHPTLEEGMRTALRDLARDLKVQGECRPEDLSEAPGM